MMFQYFKEGDAVAENGQTLRVLSTDATVYSGALLADGTPKYKEVTFQDWWDHAVADDTKKKWLDGACGGEFHDDSISIEGTMCMSLETGEPVEKPQEVVS